MKRHALSCTPWRAVALVALATATPLCAQGPGKTPKHEGTLKTAVGTRLLHSYWGGMLQKGADTFWEVHIPGDEQASPYKSHLMNSYCHAWSCTPAYLLRR